MYMVFSSLFRLSAGVNHDTHTDLTFRGVESTLSLQENIFHFTLVIEAGIGFYQEYFPGGGAESDPSVVVAVGSVILLVQCFVAHIHPGPRRDFISPYLREKSVKIG